VQLAEKIGAGIDQAIVGWRERREMAEDLALGLAAAREREEDVHTDRVDSEELPPRPVRILVDPEPLAPPKSERMARERQKPLFNDMPDSRLPQVDLLDDSQTRQDPVDAETIEFTSRLIEKKLRDFGVEVRVIAAYPGPVITRYEIEPATGVKGSQILNLAKDLARSLSLVSISSSVRSVFLISTFSVNSPTSVTLPSRPSALSRMLAFGLSVSSMSLATVYPRISLACCTNSQS
jgi:S-DNA-T family DNA segregation ATPase FtsK/SpoIIIE